MKDRNTSEAVRRGRPKTDLGRECAFCLMALGFGYDALWRKLRMSKRRARCYRTEGNFPLAFPIRRPAISVFGLARSASLKLPAEETKASHRNYMKTYAKSMRDKVSDGYVKFGLVHWHGFKREEITPEIVEIKRLQIQCLRAFKNHENQKHKRHTGHGVRGN